MLSPVSSRERPADPSTRCPIARLEEDPEIDHPFPELPELRELIIEFGDSGYVALYRHERADDAVYILAFRHQKEAGY